MKIKGLDARLLLAGIAGAALMAGCLLPNDSSKTQSSDALALRDGVGDSASHGKGIGHEGKDDSGSAKEDGDHEGSEGGDFKVYICHIPPGNPGNAHTIHVGAPAVKAHLAHGDHLGKCEDLAPAPTAPCKDSGMSMEVGHGHGKSMDHGDKMHGNPFKVVICHIPPGNPANAHTISVGAPAVRAHLAHGDHLGACSETGVDTTLAPVDCGGNTTTPPTDTSSDHSTPPPTDTSSDHSTPPPPVDTTHHDSTGTTTTPPPVDTSSDHATVPPPPVDTSTGNL